MPFPCHAVPLRVLNVSFPFDLHSAAVSDSHLPCRAHTTPFFSRPRHSTAVERRPVGYLPTFTFFRLPRGVPQRLLSETYQSSSHRSIPTTVKSGSSTLQKKTICYTVGPAVRIFPAITRTFTKDTALSEQSRGAAWHGNGMGTACYVWIGLKTRCRHEFTTASFERALNNLKKPTLSDDKDTFPQLLWNNTDGAMFLIYWRYKRRRRRTK
jgi:hypothetical protein